MEGGFLFIHNFKVFFYPENGLVFFYFLASYQVVLHSISLDVSEHLSPVVWLTHACSFLTKAGTVSYIQLLPCPDLMKLLPS